MSDREHKCIGDCAGCEERIDCSITGPGTDTDSDALAVALSELTDAVTMLATSIKEGLEAVGMGLVWQEAKRRVTDD